METIIPAAIIIGLLLLAMLTMTEQALFAQEMAGESWREMQERKGERNRTALSASAEITLTGQAVDVTIRNDGDTKLADFDQWDVILQYTDIYTTPHAEWYPYGSGGNEWNEWTEKIYLDASKDTDEVFDPGIFNPGEEMVITVYVSPTVGSSTTNTVTVATPNGITASTVFTH